MNIRQYAITTLAALFLPLVASADTNHDKFVLADRIAAKIASGAKLDIYVSYHDVSNEFSPFIRAGVQNARDQDNVNAYFVGPAGASADGQISEIETLMSKMDGLAISSVSTDALAPLINRILSAGIPVVTFNTDNPESDRLAFAGQDNVQAGREAAGLINRALDGSGTVVITTIDAAAQWSTEREKGAREALAAFDGIKIVQTLNTGTDPQEIYAAIENTMLAHPDVDGILSLECCSTPAAGTWVERNRQSDRVKVVGFDLLDETMDLVANGAIHATIDQAPTRQGYEAVHLLVRFLHGETIGDIDTGVAVYTRANINEVMQK